jgi:hypothetical protein
MTFITRFTALMIDTRSHFFIDLRLPRTEILISITVIINIYEVYNTTNMFIKVLFIMDASRHNYSNEGNNKHLDPAISAAPPPTSQPTKMTDVKDSELVIDATKTNQTWQNWILSAAPLATSGTVWVGSALLDSVNFVSTAQKTVHGWSEDSSKVQEYRDQVMILEEEKLNLEQLKGSNSLSKKERGKIKKKITKKNRKIKQKRSEMRNAEMDRIGNVSKGALDTVIKFSTAATLVATGAGAVAPVTLQGSVQVVTGTLGRVKQISEAANTAIKAVSESYAVISGQKGMVDAAKEIAIAQIADYATGASIDMAEELVGDVAEELVKGFVDNFPEMSQESVKELVKETSSIIKDAVIDTMNEYHEEKLNEGFDQGVKLGARVCDIGQEKLKTPIGFTALTNHHATVIDFSSNQNAAAA